MPSAGTVIGVTFDREVRLYRPTGMAELRLVFESKGKAWPPRLPEQPIFYPVLNFEYAAQIARDWNSTTDPFAGYVTRFEVDDNYGARFERHVVGGREHEELWVPAEELPVFNRHMTTPIDVVAAFFGPEFRGAVAETGALAGLDASEQLRVFRDLSSEPDRTSEALLGDAAATYLNFPFWVLSEQSEEFSTSVRRAWDAAATGIELPSLAEQPP